MNATERAKGLLDLDLEVIPFLEQKGNAVSMDRLFKRVEMMPCYQFVLYQFAAMASPLEARQ